MTPAKDGREAERPWWHPKLVDAAYLQRLREDYPENAHLSDEALRAKYECEEKYAVLWDHLGDAYEGYEPLADAYLALRAERDALRGKLEEIKKLKPERIGETGFQTGPQALLNIAQRIAKEALTPHFRTPRRNERDEMSETEILKRLAKCVQGRGDYTPDSGSYTFSTKCKGCSAPVLIHESYFQVDEATAWCPECNSRIASALERASESPPSTKGGEG